MLLFASLLPLPLLFSLLSPLLSPHQVSPLLSKILLLLTSFIKRPHQSLAAIGVAAFVRLMSNAGALFSEQKWEEVRGERGSKQRGEQTLVD